MVTYPGAALDIHKGTNTKLFSPAHAASKKSLQLLDVPASRRPTFHHTSTIAMAVSKTREIWSLTGEISLSDDRPGIGASSNCVMLGKWFLKTLALFRESLADFRSCRFPGGRASFYSRAKISLDQSDLSKVSSGKREL